MGEGGGGGRLKFYPYKNGQGGGGRLKFYPYKNGQGGGGGDEEKVLAMLMGVTKSFRAVLIREPEVLAILKGGTNSFHL